MRPTRSPTSENPNAESRADLTCLAEEQAASARLDSYGDVFGARVECLAEAGFRSAVGAPIMIQGRLWGALLAGAVSLTLAVRSARAEVPPTCGYLAEELGSAADGLASVLDDLRELAA